jgi:stage V sporulation protein G
MNITDVKIRKFLNDGRVKAIVSVTFDNELAIHEIKVIEGAERLFVAMPSLKGKDGVFRDIAHPISPEARIELERIVLNRYHEMISINSQMNEDDDVIESTENQ